jgi:hypothetical protein
MPRSSAIPQLSSLEALVTRIMSVRPEVDVLFLYGEDPGRCWAQEVGRRLAACVGQSGLRATWWNLDDLSQPGVLAGAVSRAMRADLIVIAIPETEGQPLPFYYWINSWLPHRSPGQSGLVALLGTPRRANNWSGRLRKYLRAVARYRRMETIIENL